MKIRNLGRGKLRVVGIEVTAEPAKVRRRRKKARAKKISKRRCSQLVRDRRELTIREISEAQIAARILRGPLV